MIRIGTSEDLQEIKTDIPPEVKKEIQEVINMLDESYGEARDIGKDLGGYALIIEDDEDINKCSELGITFDDTHIPEYVLLITTKEEKPYTQSLFSYH